MFIVVLILQLIIQIVSVISQLGKSDHSLTEMQVRCDINVDLKTYYYDYKNANFDMIRSVFNSDFNSN